MRCDPIFGRFLRITITPFEFLSVCRMQDVVFCQNDVIRCEVNVSADTRGRWRFGSRYVRFGRRRRGLAERRLNLKTGHFSGFLCLDVQDELINDRPPKHKKTQITALILQYGWLTLQYGALSTEYGPKNRSKRQRPVSLSTGTQFLRQAQLVDSNRVKSGNKSG